MSKPLIFATRASALALTQTRWVIQSLKNSHPGLVCEEKVIQTQGDRITDKPLPEIGGKGLFTLELENELLAGSVDCAVHSLKDLPVEDHPGLLVGCVPIRTDARDVIISARGYTFSSLPEGAHVGTSSTRRAAQILAARPDIVIESLRGNVDTRLQKALDNQYDAVVLAGAGLIRLNLDAHITEWISFETMLPDPGQGALAIQCRADDKTTLEYLAALEDIPTRKTVTAERQFLSSLGGGCSLPIAAYATVDHEITLTGLVATPDGTRLIKVSGSGNDPEELGARLAKDAISQGANDILNPHPTDP